MCTEYESRVSGQSPNLEDRGPFDVAATGTVAEPPLERPAQHKAWLSGNVAARVDASRIIKSARVKVQAHN